MTTNGYRAIRALDKAAVKFTYRLMVNSSGAVIAIRNEAVRDPRLGDHTNRDLCNLPIDSSMAIADIVAAIEAKWGK